MRDGWFCFALVACILVAGALPVRAAPFEARFTVVKVSGTCDVRIPATASFIAAEEGKSYSYGTSLRTGRKSSAVISFSEGNECRILANTSLVIEEDTQNKKLKTIHLSRGKVDVQLEETFHQHSELNVETASAICGAIGCTFTVESIPGWTGSSAIFDTRKGTVKIYNSLFEAPKLVDGNILSVWRSRSGASYRLENGGGTFAIIFKDVKGKPVTIEATRGTRASLTVSPRRGGKEDSVLIDIRYGDGKQQRAVTFSVPMALVGGLRRTTTTSSTTTTTTIPSNLREVKSTVTTTAPVVVTKPKPRPRQPERPEQPDVTPTGKR